MESQITNYRLERWIALFLSLLFLLPFVAEAQEIALVCTDGSAWLERQDANTPAHAWVLPAKHLEAGPVTTAACNDVPQATPARIAFNGAQSTLHWRCAPSSVEGFKQCALLLDAQVLTWRMALDDQEMRVLVSFAGDADRDGRLDLLVDISRNGSEWHPALFLSSAAKQGEVVAKVAEAVVATPEL